jgi:hypothetical protein
MNRNDLAASLLERLQTEIPEVQTWLPRPCAAEHIAVEQQPAAYLVLTEQDNDPSPRPKWRISGEVYLFATVADGGGPRGTLNELVDAVETALHRKPGEGGQGFWTTLGDSVFEVRPLRAEVGVPFAGTVEGDQGIAIVDLEIIAPG